MYNINEIYYFAAFQNAEKNKRKKIICHHQNKLAENKICL